MEIKFAVSGPPIGGAKSGINFDPKDPRKKEVLSRWYKAVTPLLKNYYGTGGDLNVDEMADVIPFTEQFGLWHPQEGIVQGHYNPSPQQKIQKLGQLRTGVAKVIEDTVFTPAPSMKYHIADMITGYGVAESIRHFYNIWGDQIRGKRAIVQVTQRAGLWSTLGVLSFHRTANLGTVWLWGDCLGHFETSCSRLVRAVKASQGW